MFTNKQEQQNLQSSVENQISNDFSNKIIVNEKMEGTPFRIVGTEQGWFIALGNHQLTEILPEREDAEIIVSTRDWNLILATISAAMNTKDRIIAEEIQRRRQELDKLIEEKEKEEQQ